MTIDGTELQNITVASLNLGNRSNENVFVEGVSAENSNNISSTLTISSANGISFETSDSTFNVLFLSTKGDISVNIDLTVDSGNFNATADSDSSGSVTLTDLNAPVVVSTTKTTTETSTTNTTTDTARNAPSTSDYLDKNIGHFPIVKGFLTH